MKFKLNKGGSLFLVAFFLFIFLTSSATAKEEIVINEIFPNPKGSDKDKEFIEIYNNGKDIVYLDDWKLKRTSKKGTVKIYKFKDDDSIKPKKYLTLKTNSLNNDGATIELLTASDKVSDDKTYHKSVEGISYNRDENGKDNSWYWATPTKDEANAENPANKKYLELIINEILPDPNKDESKNEFIELYNPNKQNVDLDGWQIRDASKTGKYIFKEDDKIKAKSYFIIYRKNFKFALNNSGGETVKLLDPNDDNNKDEYSDKIKYSQAIIGKSYNRNEKNVKKDWYWTEPTAGKINNQNPANKKYLKLLLSEILANPKGDEKKDEFIEIYNPNKKSVDLKGWRLRDDSSGGKYNFSDNKQIKAKNYLVVYRKDFKFALNNSGGETVKLIAPNNKIISEIEYKSAKENISYNYNLINKNWRWSKFLTPNKKNRFNNLPTFKFKKPKKVYKNTYTEFELNNLRDKDGDKIKIIWDFGDGHKSYLKKTKHKYTKTGKYRVKLTVKDDSEEVTKEFKIYVKKYPKYKLKIVSLMPNPIGRDAGREVIIIKNLDKKKINLQHYKIATGSSEKKIIAHPFYKDFIIKPGKTKILTNEKICKFNLLNKAGIVRLLYPNGKTADEIKYNKKKILPNETYIMDTNKQWHWQKSLINNSDKVSVLGERIVTDNESSNSNNIDITLNDLRKICSTTQQIGIDNWLDNLNDNHLWQKIMGEVL